jgi:hypothetical protein
LILERPESFYGHHVIDRSKLQAAAEAPSCASLPKNPRRSISSWILTDNRYNKKATVPQSTVAFFTLSATNIIDQK